MEKRNKNNWLDFEEKQVLKTSDLTYQRKKSDKKWLDEFRGQKSVDKTYFIDFRGGTVSAANYWMALEGKSKPSQKCLKQRKKDEWKLINWQFGWKTV